MYSQFQLCAKARAEMVSRKNINLLSHVWPFCHTNSFENDKTKKASFHTFEKILSFSNDIVSPISLIIAIIINHRLSIERSALEFTVIFLFFFHSAPTLSLEI